MTSTNRLGNRILLALVGLVAIAAGAWVALRAYPGVVPLTVPELTTEFEPLTLWIAASAAAVAIVLCLLWMLTRGRGRSSRLLGETAENGSLVFDVRVADDLLGAALSRQPDVLSVKTASYRVRRGQALRVTVTARNGCDLPRLRDDVAQAVENLDTLLERRIPVLLHVTSGVRATLAREQRVT